jgi:two-component system, sensor histidine kinase YcbA
MARRLLLLFLLMLATAFFGELKMNPFGESFRFSLGTACYFFGLIWFRTLRPLETGISVGLFLLLFRTLLGVEEHGLSLHQAVMLHIPSTVYYVIFATVLTVTGLRRRLDSPLWVGMIGALSDVAGNLGELLTRNLLGAHYAFDGHTLLILILFGSLRSFFVIGLYNMLMIRQVRILGEQQQGQIERLLLINSSLYEEGFYLQKSMRHIEDITQGSYELYKQLKRLEKSDGLASDLSRHALSIAEEVHELKKDSQRILAGLGKVMRKEQAAVEERLPLQMVGEMVVSANRKYAEMLGKRIEVSLLADVNLSTNRLYPLLSILNNLVANAVEAIQEAGRIGVEVHLRHGDIEWVVQDDGPGIQPDDAEYVFQPGYTTKYDSQGNPSAGIGLTHCRDLAAMLGGTLDLQPQEKGTRFVMRMPSWQLLDREEENSAR